MIQIPFNLTILFITLLWVLVRLAVYCKTKAFSWKREAQLLLVYICLVVVVRLTFFPFSKVDGKVQPLLFDAAHILPFRLNFVPFVNLMDYEVRREALLNVIGNSFLFLPVGIVFPIVYRKLNTHWKVIAAGVGTSLSIEILQLLFFDRVTDIDDLILNSAGYLLGYSIYLLVKKAKKKA